MGFNSGFKGLKMCTVDFSDLHYSLMRFVNYRVTRNASVKYGGPKLSSRSKNWVSFFKFLVFFLKTQRQVLKYYLTVEHDFFHPYGF